MDALKSWAITVCFAALAAGMAGILTPNGNLEKVYKFAVSLFFLCCVLVPIFKIRQITLNPVSYQTTQQQTVNIQQTVNEQTIQEAQNQLNQLVNNCCIRNGVTPEKVNVTLEMPDKESYKVTEVEVVLNHKDMTQKDGLAASIKKELGLDVTISEGEKK